MALNFPANPTTGDEYSAGGFTWTWSGSSWDKIASAAVGIPSGETADRPASPAIGDQFYNGTLGVLEIYTTSGWLPATGANDFNVVLTGSETIATLDKEYFSGAYTISSALSDTTFDVYLFDTANNLVAYSGTPSINSNGNFNKVQVLGGTNGDLLSFSYKTTFSSLDSTTDVYGAPYIDSVSPVDLPNIDDTVTIAGGNFDTDIQVWFDGQNSYSSQAKSVVYGSSTSIVATRPDDAIEDNAPYSVRVVNPGINESATSSAHVFQNITVGGDPIWTTSAGNLDDAVAGQAYSFTLSASDPDGGSVSYSLVSGQLPSGLSLNSATGEISGTPTGSSQSFTIAATDNGDNVVNRSFSISVGLASGGTISTDGGYVYHTFTGNGTFEAFSTFNADILVVAGGGAGGVGQGSSSVPGAGGGAGGYRALSQQSISTGTYSVTVGAGGTSLNTSAEVTGPSGTGSQFGSIAATGGGGGASRTGSGSSIAGSGGSGGGANINQGGGGVGGTGNAGGYTPPEGFDGGSGSSDPGWSAGGGGASAAGASWNANGDGGAGSQWLNGNYYAGGGGRGKPNDPTAPIGTGGIGGGGSGVNGTQAENGEQFTGGGGGGGRAAADGGGASGAGGSGIVIVRYLA